MHEFTIFKAINEGVREAKSRSYASITINGKSFVVRADGKVYHDDGRFMCEI